MPSQCGRDYLVKNLKHIFHHSEILAGCEFFNLPVRIPCRSDYKKIITYVCKNSDEIKSYLHTLTDTELAFIIYYENTKGSNKLYIALSMFSKNFEETHVSKLVSHFFGGEFFGIAINLSFNSEGDLSEIFFGRYVCESIRRNSICRHISRSALYKIYSHLNSENTNISSCGACHIGAVKFYYPLLSYYDKQTGECSSDIDPRIESVCLDNLEKKTESLSYLSSSPESDFASCPDKRINLGKLLCQYQLKDALEVKKK